MAILRAAFWLGVGYLVVGPNAHNQSMTADQLAAEATAAGARIVLEQTADPACDRLECKAIHAVVLTSNLAQPKRQTTVEHEIDPDLVAPVPPPRPDWIG